MNIFQAFKTPYTHLGLVISFVILSLLSTLCIVLSMGAQFSEGLIGTGSVPLQILFTFLSILFILPVLGYLARILRNGDFPSFSFGRSLITGLKLAVVLFIYSIPYDLSLFVYDTAGVALSIAYMVLLAIFLPAIVINTAQCNSILAGFKWNQIIRHLSGHYAKAYLVGLLIFMVYSLIAYWIGVLLLTFATTDILFYIITVVYYLIYSLFLFIALTTVALLFSQDPKKRKKHKKKQK